MSNVINPKLGIFEKTPKVPLASLPPAALFQAITRYEISDYGGNIATVVNGAWRFEYPFRTTWAGRPAVGLVPTGTELQVTDYGNQKWISDGVNWRPAQGRVLIKQMGGLQSTPVASLSGITSGTFSIPGGNPRIQAGMIAPHSRVIIQHKMQRNGTTASAISYSRLCIPSSTDMAGNSVSQLSIGNNFGWVAQHYAHAAFGSNPTSFFATPDGLHQYYGYKMVRDQSADVNTGQAMEVLFSISDASPTDSFRLVDFSVFLEG